MFRHFSIRGALEFSVIAVALLSAVAGCDRTPQDASAAKLADVSAGSTPVAKSSEIDHLHPVISMLTSAGEIRIRLDADRAPATVRNFLDYVNDGFYDNTLIHYVDPDKLLVAGGYSIDQTLKLTRQPIRNEAHNGWKNTRGTVAMARDASRIDSANSQFFINLTNAPQRDYRGDTPADYGYCVFGEVTEGLEIADQISNAPVADHGHDLVQIPTPPITVQLVRVVE